MEDNLGRAIWNQFKLPHTASQSPTGAINFSRANKNTAIIGPAAACAFEWTYHWSKQQKLAYQHSRKSPAKMHAKTAFPGAGRGLVCTA